MKRPAYFVFIAAAIMALATLAACNSSTVYDEYAHTPIAGWEKNDSLSFEIPPLAATGYYRESLGLRTMGSFPFTGLTLIVRQTIYPANKHEEYIERVDTVQCQLTNKNGGIKGQGISYYQYNFPINVYKMSQGDSIHIAIRHDMKREILPGVSDVGVKISRN